MTNETVTEGATTSPDKKIEIPVEEYLLKRDIQLREEIKEDLRKWGKSIFKWFSGVVVVLGVLGVYTVAKVTIDELLKEEIKAAKMTLEGAKTKVAEMTATTKLAINATSGASAGAQEAQDAAVKASRAARRASDGASAARSATEQATDTARQARAAAEKALDAVTIARAAISTFQSELIVLEGTAKRTEKDFTRLEMRINRKLEQEITIKNESIERLRQEIPGILAKFKSDVNTKMKEVGINEMFFTDDAGKRRLYAKEYPEEPGIKGYLCVSLFENSPGGIAVGWSNNYLCFTRPE